MWRWQIRRIPLLLTPMSVPSKVPGKISGHWFQAEKVEWIWLLILIIIIDYHLHNDMYMIWIFKVALLSAACALDAASMLPQSPAEQETRMRSWTPLGVVTDTARVVHACTVPGSVRSRTPFRVLTDPASVVRPRWYLYVVKRISLTQKQTFCGNPLLAV